MFVNEWLMAIVVFFVWYFYQINHVGNAKDPLTLRAAVKNSRQIVVLWSCVFQTILGLVQFLIKFEYMLCLLTVSRIFKYSKNRGLGDP